MGRNIVARIFSDGAFVSRAVAYMNQMGKDNFTCNPWPLSHNEHDRVFGSDTECISEIKVVCYENPLDKALGTVARFFSNKLVNEMKADEYLADMHSMGFECSLHHMFYCDFMGTTLTTKTFGIILTCHGDVKEYLKHKALVDCYYKMLTGEEAQCIED